MHSYTKDDQSNWKLKNGSKNFSQIEKMLSNLLFKNILKA